MSTVLIVDDSAVDRRLAAGLLEKNEALTVSHAADGNGALQELERQGADVIVTDLQMPEMNGLQLLEAVKEDFPFVPVILMTAKGSEEIASQALKQGAASYVPKTRLAEDLLPTVERVLSGTRGDRAQTVLMHYLTEGRSRFNLRNDLSLIRALVGHVQQTLRCLPLADETQRLRVGIALEQALLNAYYHGSLETGSPATSDDPQAVAATINRRLLQEPYCHRRIDVQINVSRSQAVFTVADEGPGFDTSTLPDTDDPRQVNPEWGRGIVLMRSIMDEVWFNQAGNEVTLLKRSEQPEEADEEE